MFFYFLTPDFFFLIKGQQGHSEAGRLASDCEGNDYQERLKNTEGDVRKPKSNGSKDQRSIPTVEGRLLCQRCDKKGDRHNMNYRAVRAGADGWNGKLGMRFGNGTK